jgi:hypothetical protein
MLFEGMPISRLGDDVANADASTTDCPMPARLWLMAGLKKAITSAAARTAPANTKPVIVSIRRSRVAADGSRFGAERAQHVRRKGGP